MSKTPTIRKVAWSALIPQLLFIAVLTGIAYLLNPEYALILGAALYILLSFLARTVVGKNHLKGIHLTAEKDYSNAILEFQKSYEFFKKYPWMDKYRYITLLSASAIPYGEMALNNIAYCYAELGDGPNALKYYKLTLKEYPDSVIAKIGLESLNNTPKD